MGNGREREGNAGVNTDHCPAELSGTILPGKSHTGTCSRSLMQCLTGCLRNEVDKEKCKERKDPLENRKCVKRKVCTDPIGVSLPVVQSGSYRL